MAYEMRAGQGSLFKNQKKTSEKSPALTGKVMLPNGEVRWISAWTKVTETGDKWISVSIGDLVQQQMSQHSVDKGNGYQRQPKVGVDDDVPF